MGRGGGGLFERGACLMLWPRGERSVGAGGGTLIRTRALLIRTRALLIRTRALLIRLRALIRAKYGIFFS